MLVLFDQRADKRHARRIVVEHDLVRLMTDRPQRHDRRAGAEQVIGQKRHLVVRAEVFDHLGAGDFRTLKVPGSVLVLVAVARMEVEDLVREIALGLRADGTSPPPRVQPRLQGSNAAACARAVRVGSNFGGERFVRISQF